jgi:hypothetical protein
MTSIKPSDHGIVVAHKELGTHYAVTDAAYNSEVHRKVRDLKPGESIYSFTPKDVLDLNADSEGDSALEGL